VAGRFALDWTMLHWQLPYRIIHALEGDNDGLVAVSSARWGEAFEVWEGDHASLVNRTLTMTPACRRWPDRVPQYAELLRRPRGRRNDPPDCLPSPLYSGERGRG